MFSASFIIIIIIIIFDKNRFLEHTHKRFVVLSANRNYILSPLCSIFLHQIHFVRFSFSFTSAFNLNLLFRRWIIHIIWLFNLERAQRTHTHTHEFRFLVFSSVFFFFCCLFFYFGLVLFVSFWCQFSV